jgi:hypothetical protein
MVYGPIAHSVAKMSSLNTSSGDVYRLFNGTEKTVPDTSFWAYADVRDRKTTPISRHILKADLKISCKSSLARLHH